MAQVEDQQICGGNRIVGVARLSVGASVQFTLFAESQREVLPLAFCRQRTGEAIGVVLVVIYAADREILGYANFMPLESFVPLCSSAS